MNISYRNKSLLTKFLYTCVFLSICVLSVCLFLCLTGNHVERAGGKIKNEAYIWQRQWNPEVSEALSRAASEMSGFAVLAAEVSFRNGQIEDVVSVPIDYESLRQTHKPVALALRIGPFSGDFRQNQQITEFLSDIACSLIKGARNNEIEPLELPIDFDCSESILDSYKGLIKVFKSH